MNRRFRTVVFGAVPLACLTFLATSDRVPGTDISLTVPYASEGSGPTFDVLSEVNGAPVVSIAGAHTHKTRGELSMTTVLLRHQLSLAQAMGRWLTTKDTLVPIETVFPQNLTEDEVQERNEQAFSDSESTAVLAALDYLGKPVVVGVRDVVKNSPADGVLHPGDELVAVDGQKVTHPMDVRSAVLERKPGDTVTVEVTNPAGQKKTRTITLAKDPRHPDSPLMGISMDARAANGVNVTFNLKDVGGPSAGLIFTLGIIDKLTDDELTGGLHVAGTGTISADGTVGPIGGIQHKVTAAHRDAHADVFLAPAANCEEALQGDHGDMPIIKVTNLSGAIESLHAYEKGEDYPSCR